MTKRLLPTELLPDFLHSAKVSHSFLTVKTSLVVGSGTFFVSSIILRAKHELTSKAASKSVLLRLLQVGPAIVKLKHILLDRSLNSKNKALDAVSKRHQQLQRDHDIARVS